MSAQKYLQAVIPSVILGLRSSQAQELCIISVGVVVDICTAVAADIQPYCDQIMEALKTTLSDHKVARDVKPAVISCFGDIAMAITGAYEPYVQVSAMMLMQASQQCMASSDDEELLYFINNLRLAILEAYSGIIIGLADGNKLNLFMANIPPIFQFLQYLATPEADKDDRVLAKAVALIGDIVQQMAPQNPELKNHLNHPWLAHLIQEASVVPDDEARQSANWTRGVVHNALQM
jgi:importin subunit beta-1